MPTLLSFGHGYSAAALARRLVPRGWRITGTTRSAGRVADIEAQGVTPVLWPGTDMAPLIAGASHILVSAGPDDGGDPVLAALGAEIAAAAPHLAWLGYLSTTAVYGDHDGGWVDEETPVSPSTRRGHLRALAESQWREVPGLPLHLFRLAGIYGPGRGPFAKLRRGVSRRIVKPGQVFSRIHVDDIAQVLEASIGSPRPGAIYNVCDDDPAPPQEVIEHAARLLGQEPPPAVPVDEADMSPMARSFYAENKRVRNDRIKSELGVRLIHPDYRSGLAALARDDAETG